MFAVLVVIGPVVALLALAWILVPAGFVAAAWPAAALLLSASLISLPLMLIYRLHQRSMDRAHLTRLPESAAAWLRRKLASLGLDSVDVVTVEGEGSAYHPPSDTIILRETTYAEHTVRARAVAAHELGHAAFAHFSPRLSRLAMVARRWSSRLFASAISGLIATALIDVPHLRPIAFVLIAIAAALSVAVVLEEAGASLRATRVLAGDLDRRSLRAAVTGLVLALMTYVSQLAPMVIALAYWPELIGRLGGGVVELAAPLSGVPAVLVQVAGLVVLAATVIGVVELFRRRRGGILDAFATLAVLMIGPSLAFAVAGQELVLAHPWALALAAATAWEVIALPFGVVLSLGTNLAARGIDLVAPVTRFVDDSQLRSLNRVEAELVSAVKLARHERESLVERIWDLRWRWLYLPLVLAYWGLFG